MNLSDFDYNLPPELIANEPARPRDHSRLLVLDKKTGEIEHKHFYDIIDYLKAGDVLVLNNSKVFPARLIGEKRETGGRVEVFLTARPHPLPHPCPPLPRGEGKEIWQCLVGAKRKCEGLEVEFPKGLKARLMKNNHDGTWLVEFNLSGKRLMEVVGKIGLVPLPPYISKQKAENGKPFDPAQGRQKTENKKNYQTVYADANKVGSVAAPTAGFHFTPALLKRLKKKGVQIEYVTLHVGLGTFLPVKTDNIKKHKMHSEMVEINKNTAKRIIQAKKEGRRVIAVGTTSVRTLESVLINSKQKTVNSKQIIKNRQPFDTAQGGQTNIFIYPGYEFKVVDAMITNFHLPKSTLLMLVSAFASLKIIKKAYGQAIEKKYRFYSFGDAMLII